MPVNEIMAPSYLRIKYTTHASQHNLTIYMNGLIRVNPSPVDENILQFAPATNPTWTALETPILDLIMRAYKDGSVAAPTVDSIEAWQSVVGGENVFVGYGNPQTISSGSATLGTASGYRHYRFRTVDNTTPRQQAQFTFYESQVNVAPQRSSFGTVPTTDNGTFVWKVEKGLANWFTSQDGYVITNASSLSLGYNRKLARSYGKRLTP